MAHSPNIGRRAGSICMAAGLCVSCLAPAARAQRNTGEQGPFVPWVGEMGTTETMAQIIARDAKNARPWNGRVLFEADEREDPDRRHLPLNPLSPSVPQWPWNFNGPNPPTILPPSPMDNPQTVSPTQNFQSMLLSESGFIPPDSQGAVGATQFACMANGRVKAFDKVSGALLFSVT